MRPLYKMGIIQIEVTNACTRSCANCTRFCGHHQQPFFMDVETFKTAVDSMEGFGGMIGVMGGEPTLHPQFEEIVRYYAQQVGTPGVRENARLPIANFSEYLIENEMQDWTAKRGLWSALGRKYYKHFELIQDTFDFQLINDHTNPGLHQSLLVKRKELGVPDEVWYPLRDKCWVQNIWSASITPKGAFFCEVAAAMDTLFDGPGGWPIEKGWWKREPKDFGSQLDWCERCGACLDVPRQSANSEIDTVSPEMFEQLKDAKSPKLLKGKVKAFDPNPFDGDSVAYSSEWYLPDGDNTQRVGATNKTIMPHKLNAVTLESKVKFAADGFESITNLDSLSQLSNLLPDLKDWVLLVSPGFRANPNLAEEIKKQIFNPGVLYCYNPLQPIDLNFFNTCPTVSATADPSGPLPFEIIMFNQNAMALREATWENIEEFIGLWAPDKRVHLPGFEADRNAETRLAVLRALEKQKTRLMTEHILSVWGAQTTVNKRIALYGAGKHSEWLLEKANALQLPMPMIIVDDHPHLSEICGIKVVSSSDFRVSDVDIVMISSDSYTTKMESHARELWPNAVIINPYAHFKKPFFQK